AHHLGSEAAHPALARCVGQMSEQQPADAAPLHVVDDGDRDLRGMSPLTESNEACHANDHVGAALHHAARATWSVPSVFSNRCSTESGRRGIAVKNRK